MISGCPGSQNLKQPRPEIFRCPFCGEELEIWTDETETKCTKCGRKVYRINGQCCIDWCKYARDCVGGERYDAYIKRKAAGEGGEKV